MYSNVVVAKSKVSPRIRVGSLRTCNVQVPTVH